MGSFLFKVGDIVSVETENRVKKMLIIGTCVKDEEGKIHDYAGVPYPDGYNGKLCCFEHRELTKEGY